MDIQTSKETFYKTRTLTGRFMASFRFLKNHLMLFIRLSMYILIPFAIIVSLCMLYFVNLEYSTIGLIGVSSLLLIASVIGGTLYCSLIYTLLKQYAENNCLPDYRNLKPLKSLLIKNFKKVLLVGVVFCLIIVVLGVFAGLLAKLSLYTLILTLPLLIFIIIPFSYTVLISVLEDQGVFYSLKRSFKVGVKSWGGTFMIVLIMAIIAEMIQFIASLPVNLGINILVMAKQSQQMGEAAVIPGYFPFLLFLLMVISLIISLVAHLLLPVSIAYQYGNIVAHENLKTEIQNY